MEQVDVLLTLKRWDRFSSESLYLLMFTRTLLRRTFPPSFSFPSSPSSLPRQQWPFLFADKPKDTGFFKIFFFINWFACLFIFIFTLKCHSKFNYRFTENKKVAKWFGNLKKPRGRITTWASLLKYVLLQELIYLWSRERSWKYDGKHRIKLQGRSQAFSKGVSSLCQAVLTSFPFT